MLLRRLAKQQLRLLLGQKTYSRGFSTTLSPSSRRAMILSAALLAGVLGLVGFRYFTDRTFRQKIDGRIYPLLGIKVSDYLQVTPQNISSLRSPLGRVDKFVQIHYTSDDRSEASKKIHPHYFWYRKTLLVRARKIGVFHLYLGDWQDPKSKALLEHTLGTPPDLLVAERTQYILVNGEGDLLCFGDSSAFDPHTYGIRFLEGPPKVVKADEILAAGPYRDEYEHTFFVCYNGQGRVGIANFGESKGVLLNCFRKLYAELSYGLNEVCTFVEVQNPSTARELGLDPAQPGLIHAFHTVSRLNEPMYHTESARKPIRESLFSVSHQVPMEQKKLEEKYGTRYHELNAKHFDEIYATAKNYVFDSLCHERKVMYCPKPDYLRLYLPFYKERRERVLYVAANPLKVGMEEFGALYKALIGLSGKHPGLRIVLTDLQDAADFTFILPTSSAEKFAVRYIDYGHFYYAGVERPEICSDFEKSGSQPKFVEKYRLETGDASITAGALEDFVEKCEKKTLPPYQESEEEGDKQDVPHKLTARNYKQILFERDLDKQRVVIFYCGKCAKCRQVLEAAKNLTSPSDRSLYFYNMGNESELNALIKEAPMILFYPKGSKSPAKARELTEVRVASKDGEKEIADCIADISK